jgi:hypothetical protein
MSVSINKSRKKNPTGKFEDRSSEFFSEILEIANSFDETIFNCNGATFDRGAVYWQ